MENHWNWEAVRDNFTGNYDTPSLPAARNLFKVIRTTFPLNGDYKLAVGYLAHADTLARHFYPGKEKEVLNLITKRFTGDRSVTVKKREQMGDLEATHGLITRMIEDNLGKPKIELDYQFEEFNWVNTPMW